jgi:hypothetical protein
MPKIMQDIDTDSDYGPLFHHLKNKVPKTRSQLTELKSDYEAVIDLLKKKGRDNEADKIEEQLEVIKEKYETIEDKEKKIKEDYFRDKQKEICDAIVALQRMEKELTDMREKLERDYIKELQEAKLAKVQKEIEELNKLRDILATQISGLKNDFHQADTKIHSSVSSFVQHVDEVFEKYQLQTVLSHEKTDEYRKCSDNIKSYLVDAEQKKLTGQATSIESDEKVVHEEEKVLVFFEEAKKKLLENNKDVSMLQEEIALLTKKVREAREEINTKKTLGQKIEEKVADVENIEKLIAKKNEEKLEISKENKMLKKEIKQVESLLNGTNAPQNVSNKTMSKESEKSNLEDEHKPRLKM